MRVPIKCKQLVKCMGEVNRSLHMIQFDPVRKCIVCTNGVVMVRIPVQVDPEDVHCQVSIDCWNHAVKTTKGGFIVIYCESESCRTVDGIEWPNPTSHPVGWKVIMDASAEESRPVTLVLNANQLRLVQNAFASEFVAIRFHVPDSGYVNQVLEIRPHNTSSNPLVEGAVGLMMPCN